MQTVYELKGIQDDDYVKRVVSVLRNANLSNKDFMYNIEYVSLEATEVLMLLEDEGTIQEFVDEIRSLYNHSLSNDPIDWNDSIHDKYYSWLFKTYPDHNTEANIFVMASSPKYETWFNLKVGTKLLDI